MPFAETLLATFFATLASLGLTKGIQTKTTKNGETQVFQDGKLVSSFPRQIDVRSDPLTFAQVDQARVLTSDTERPQGANITLKNPFKSRSTRLLSLSFVPDANFKTNGILEVLKGGTRLVKSSSASTYTDTDVINIPLPESGLTLGADEDIEIRIWASSLTVGLTAQFMIGDF